MANFVVVMTFWQLIILTNTCNAQFQWVKPLVDESSHDFYAQMVGPSYYEIEAVSNVKHTSNGTLFKMCV